MAEDRLTLLCGQSPKLLTGIDFVAVADPTDQTVLHVYFLLDPPSVSWGSGFAAVVEASALRIWAPSGGRTVAEPKVIGVQWGGGGGGREYLIVTVDQPGDFSRYRLSLTDAKVDYHFSQVDFSFKQACPTTLDCKLVPADESCPEPAADLVINPLARDFGSLRRALLDYTNQRYPTWEHQSNADVGVMMLEVMAAIGDEFNYVKDRFARERVLDELSQRRSLRHMLRLLDYEIHDGRNPSTWLELDVGDSELINDDDDVLVDAGTRVWAHRYGELPVTFELGEGMTDYRDVANPRRFTIRREWNTLTVQEPDGAQPKLAKGATQLFLNGDYSLTGWAASSRELVLHEDPSDGSAPKRHLVHVSELELVVDNLNGGVATTRVAWDASEALPCPMVIADMSVKANVVPATAGESFTDYFSVRGDGTHEDAVEREGPLDGVTNTRPPMFRYSPIQCETQRLGWLGALASSTPEIEVQDITGIDLEDWVADRLWIWRRTLLDSNADDAHFTIEDGTWRRIVGYRLANGSELVHKDWAANAGYTVRFGDNEFGRVPADGTDFRVRYRSGPGIAANVNAGAIKFLAHPVTGEGPDDPRIGAVSNPFDVADGVEPESMQRAKFLGPDAFRHDTFSAVTPADYEGLAERLSWVQRANATFRWTGSWLTIFVSADPLGAFGMTRDQLAELEDLMDCVRQVGRDVHVLAPDYIDLDVWVSLCLKAGAYAGQVEAAVVEALTGAGGFFGPDNFTFGTPLRRSQLEAAIQRVPGVLAVEQIELRAREKTPRRVFQEAALEVGAGQIIRVLNDPSLPEQGAVKVTVREVV